MGVEFRARYRVGFVVNKAVVIGSIEHGVYMQTENVLVIRREHTGVHNSTKGDVDTFIDRPGAQNSSRTNLIRDIAGLVENEGKNVFVVCHCDD